MASAIIVGAGTVGLAAARWLRRAGVEVTVLERFTHIHTFGSHGGHTRVIRRAYFEGSVYVPLVNRAMKLWHELGDDLVVECGVVIVGDPADEHMVAAVEATRASGVKYELGENRWPLTPPKHWAALWVPSDGYLRVDRCLHALRGDTVVRYDTQVTRVLEGGVELASGETLRADQVIVCAGAYTKTLFPEINLRAQRRVLSWTRPPTDQTRSMPVWASFEPEGLFYGFPWRDEGIDGFKLALHPVGETTDEVDPNTVDRDVSPADLEVLDEFLARRLPAGTGPHIQSQVCLYGTTPSGDFILDWHPAIPRTLVLAGLSGHGFKFAPALGELAAQIVAGASPPPHFHW